MTRGQVSFAVTSSTKSSLSDAGVFCRQFLAGEQLDEDTNTVGVALLDRVAQLEATQQVLPTS
jgi:hypothetical protein